MLFSEIGYFAAVEAVTYSSHGETISSDGIKRWSILLIRYLLRGAHHASFRAAVCVRCRVGGYRHTGVCHNPCTGRNRLSAGYDGWWDAGASTTIDFNPDPLFLQGYIFETEVRSSGLTGLGLHFCRRTVERWGGRFGYTPRPGGGSRFWFRLPCAV